MKYLKSAVLFSVLVIFPGVSWYYLQSGLDFRKDLHAELQSDGRSYEDLIKSDSLKSILSNKTTLLVLDDAHANDIDKIHTQFEGSYTYQKLNVPADGLSNVQGFAMLIDTAGIIRYEYSDANQMKRMVQHLSLVIPKRPRKDIVFKK